MDLRKLDQIEIRRFLATESGMMMMLNLRERTPGVARGDQFSIIFDSGRAEGWKDCLNAIAEITPREQEKSAKEDQPGLEA